MTKMKRSLEGFLQTQSTSTCAKKQETVLMLIIMKRVLHKTCYETKERRPKNTDVVMHNQRAAFIDRLMQFM